MRCDNEVRGKSGKSALEQAKQAKHALGDEIDEHVDRQEIDVHDAFKHYDGEKSIRTVPEEQLGDGDTPSRDKARDEVRSVKRRKRDEIENKQADVYIETRNAQVQDLPVHGLSVVGCERQANLQNKSNENCEKEI